MKEFDEEQAVDAMAAAIEYKEIDRDYLYQVLDLIFDYDEENGHLDIENDEDEDIDAIVAYIRKYLAKEKDIELNAEEIRALVEAELAYEESLL